MRTGGTLYHSIRATQMTTAEATTSSKATFSPPATLQPSPWHSPVPYLFGGLAAMLGLIAFALLILACSYWRLSGEISEDDGDKKEGSSSGKGSVVFEEKFLVIMAGNVRPTFLATPCIMSNKASLMNDEKSDTSSNQTDQNEGKLNDGNKMVHEDFGEGESRVTREQSH